MTRRAYATAALAVLVLLSVACDGPDRPPDTDGSLLVSDDAGDALIRLSPPRAGG